VHLDRKTTYPVDLLAVAALTLLALPAALLDAPSWLRVPLGLLFVLALPGYAFVAALFPERYREPVGDVGRRGLQPLERVALSLGLSIAIVPLLGLALNYTPFGIRLVPVTLTVASFTVACAGIAWYRRMRLPEDERLLLALRIDSIPWAERTTLDKALSVGLVLAVLFAGGSLVYVLVTPRTGETFTEFYILGPTGKAACYPASYSDRYRPSASDLACPATIRNLTIGIVNHEGQDQTYWLRILWTKETRLPDNSTRVEEVWVARLTNVRLPHVPVDLSLNATFKPQHEETYALPPPPTNGTLRLSFQLYREEPPAPTPDASILESPYRRLHLFIQA
jgi:uncharacterized membrane protein